MAIRPAFSNADKRKKEASDKPRAFAFVAIIRFSSSVKPTSINSSRIDFPFFLLFFAMKNRVEYLYANVKEVRAMHFVYFIQQGSDGPIKIGMAENVQQRLDSLQLGNSDLLVVIGVAMDAAVGHPPRKSRAAPRLAQPIPSGVEFFS